MGKFRQISYTLISNILATLVSALITFILPKILGVESYGYFQLFIFYLSYVGVLHFGWVDGILLRYGGAYYNELDKSKFSAQLYQFVFFQFVIGLILSIFFEIIPLSEDKRIVFKYIAILLPFTNIRGFCLYILQATSRIKEYAAMVIIEKIVYMILVMTLVIFGEREFAFYIMANISGTFLSMIYGIYQCRDIVKEKPTELKKSLKETKENIKVGSRLLFSNLASILIVGIVRQAIEIQWSVEQFGKVSLSLSISNMIMVFMNAVAVVLFPMLRRMQEKELLSMYIKIRNFLMLFIFGVLIFYYPVKEILSIWLPQYAESLRYLALLFPICVFESKMSILINLYYQTLRKEKEIMYVNIVTVILSLLLTITTVFIIKNIEFAIFNIVILLGFRCVFAEIKLLKYLNIKRKIDIVIELIMVFTFIISSWFIGGIIGVLIYGLTLFIYYFLKKEEILYVINEFVEGLKRGLK